MPNANFDPISCACGCGEMFTPKKRCQIYKTARHKMKAWTIDHPRQRIGVYTTVKIPDGWELIIVKKQTRKAR